MKTSKKQPTAEIIVSAKTSYHLSIFLLMLKAFALFSNNCLCFRIARGEGVAASQPNQPEQQPNQPEQQPNQPEKPSNQPVRQPEILNVPGMQERLDALVEAGELSPDYQLKTQSWTERSIIVAYLSGELRKKCMWRAFAELWHCDKQVLKSAYAKHSDTEAARKYYVKLEEILQ